MARNLDSIADLLDDLKTGIPALDAAVGVDKKKKRKSRDPNMPKNPKSAYILFSMAKREEVKKEKGGDVREVMTELARRWQALSDKQKQVCKGDNDRMGLDLSLLLLLLFIALYR